MSEQRGTITASADEWRELGDLAGLCRQAVDNWNAFAARTRWEVDPNSRYAEETALLSRQPSPSNYSWTKDDLQAAPGASFVFLAVARQHLLAVAELLESGNVLFSLGPTIRSIIEHLARVAWATDPRCTLRQRLARAFWTRHDDLRQARKLAVSLNSMNDSRTYTALYRQLRDETLPAMFWPSEITHGKDGDIATVHGQSLPGLSASIGFLSDIYEGRDDWGTAQIYNFLSATTHPTVQIFRSRMREHPDDGHADAGPARPLRLGLDDLREPRELTYLALRCYVQMWRLIAGYQGLDQGADEILTIATQVDALRTDR